MVSSDCSPCSVTACGQQTPRTAIRRSGQGRSALRTDQPLRVFGIPVKQDKIHHSALRSFGTPALNPRHLSFSRDALLQLYTTAPPAAAAVNAVRRLGLRAVCCLRRLHGNGRIGRPSSSADTTAFVSCYRGCRSGRYRPPSVPKSSSPSPSHAGSDRHSKHRECNMNFGSLNVRALANKVDHLLEVRCDHNIHSDARFYRKKSKSKIEHWENGIAIFYIAVFAKM